jgi:CHASE3 domain sensor protein
MLASPWLPAVGALAALALAVVAANDSARRVEARLDTARQETSHLVLLRELRTALVNAETAQRGYLLTREDSFLEPYRLSLDAARVALSRVDALARDEPDTAPAIETLKAEVAVAVTELSETVDLAQEGRRDEA